MDTYADSVIDRHNQADAHPVSHPAVPHAVLSESDCPSTDAGDQAADALTKPLPAPAVRRFQLAMSGTVPLPLPDLDGPPGRLGLSVTRPDLFPSLSDV